MLRCQLPKKNDFYPPTGDGDDEDWVRHTSRYWAKSTCNDRLNPCAVCGQRSRGKCPRQQLWFCGPDHQKECLRAGKRRNRARGGADANDVSAEHLPSVYHESELVVEEEPDIDASNTKSDSSATSAKGALFPSKDITDADADLEQSDLNALTGNVSLAEAATGVTDPTTLAFYARMSIGGKENDVRDQCLRYCRWPGKDDAADEVNEEEDVAGPLWLSSENLPPAKSATGAGSGNSGSFPPACQYCGAPRAFEFQILPQMLHYLLHDPDSDADDDGSGAKSRRVLTESERAILLEAKYKIESGMDLPEGFREQHEAAVARARDALLGVGGGGKGDREGGLDWGTIAVYTCTASCGDGGLVPGCSENGAYREEAAWVQPPLD